MELAFDHDNVPVLTFPVRLRLAREAAGMKQGELAERTGISRRSIVNYEMGATNPNRPNILSIALATGVSLKWLMQGSTSEGQCPTCGQEVSPGHPGQPPTATQNRCSCENPQVSGPCQLHFDGMAEVYHIHR